MENAHQLTKRKAQREIHKDRPDFRQGVRQSVSDRLLQVVKDDAAWREGRTERDHKPTETQLDTLPTLFHGADNGGELIIQQHDVGRLPRNVRASEAHRNADLRLLEGRRIVDPVA